MPIFSYTALVDGNVLSAADINTPLSNAANATVPVANGGTGITTGTSGGVLAYTAAGTLASSSLLAANGVVYGGGAGVAPSATAAGAAGTVFIGGSPPSFSATLGTEDSRTTTVARPFTIQQTTSGTPAAGIGTGLLFNAESGDENPSSFGAIDFVASDITAGSEDTYLSVPLRVAGRALDEKYRFVSTAGEGFAAIFTHAVTADRTYTLPDASVTLGNPDPLTLTTGAASPPVANTLYKDNIPKVWARITNSGSPTLVDSFNVSGLVDDGTGTTTVTIDTDLANGSYAVVATLGQDPNASHGIGLVTAATTGFQIVTRNSGDTLTDYPFSVVAIGDG